MGSPCATESYVLRPPPTQSHELRGEPPPAPRLMPSAPPSLGLELELDELELPEAAMTTFTSLGGKATGPTEILSPHSTILEPPSAPRLRPSPDPELQFMLPEFVLPEALPFDDSSEEPTFYDDMKLRDGFDYGYLLEFVIGGAYSSAEVGEGDMFGRNSDISTIFGDDDEISSEASSFESTSSLLGAKIPQLAFPHDGDWLVRHA